MIWLWIVLGLYLLVIFGMCLLSTFPPRVPVFFSPGLLGLPQEDVAFTTQDGIGLKGWWLPAENSKSVAVLAHGYLMNRSELSPLAVWLLRRGVSCLVFDFRAHGKSGGRKSSFGWFEAEDVLAAVRFARARAPGSKIALIGSSMGAVASAFALSREPGAADALVLDCAYSRLWVASLGWWRFLGGRVLQVLLAPTVVAGPLIAGLNPFRVDVAKALREVSATPVLLLHGDQDRLAPPIEAERNLASCPKGSRLVWLEGQNHAEGRWNLPEAYLGALEEYLISRGILDRCSPSLGTDSSSDIMEP